MTQQVLVLATSLDSSSRSQILARHARQVLDERDVPAELVDLREPGSAERLGPRLGAATHILLSVPVYNFDANAATKQVIEDHGGAFEGKTVGFICAAGGNRSYMSILGLANSLMLDFRCWIVPRFVYATGADFDGDLPNPAIQERIAGLVDDLLSR